MSKDRTNAAVPDYRELASEQVFERLISDLLQDSAVRSMDQQIHHNRITTLEHCLSVSYASFCVARRLKLDCRAAARGAMLHDLYLYDWHETVPPEGLHGFTHPGIALRNAGQRFDLNSLERNIILRHMWPLTIIPPAHLESWIVCLADKYCALMEVLDGNRKNRLERFKQTVTLQKLKFDKQTV